MLPYKIFLHLLSAVDERVVVICSMKDKIKAFLVHLGISAIIALLAVLVVYGLWNPSPLHIATGITKIFLLILGIDLVLGPVLTFLVYKKGKKTLKFDLAVIAILQFSALCYGLYTAYQARPAWVVYSVDRFDLVRANEIDVRNLGKAEPIYQKPNLFGVQYVATIIPSDDVEAKNEILFDELSSGVSPSQKPELYAPLEQERGSIQSKAMALTELEKYNPKSTVNDIVSKYPQARGWLPLKATATDMTVLVDKEGHVVEIVDLRPWE